MKMIGVIPARFGASRFPGKPLAPLRGKPMIQWVIEGARQSRLLQEIFVTTDHKEIAQASEQAGAKVLMTTSDLPSGTDRIFEATKNMDFDVVINIQGDEPLMTGSLVDSLAGIYSTSLPSGTPTFEMATLAHALNESEAHNPNIVKLVMNHNAEAIYFSRFPIPHSRHTATDLGGQGAYKHIGLYAYSKKFLKKFCETPPVLIEKAEGLEQLRALYLGARIKVVLTEAVLQGVDTPEDLGKVDRILAERSVGK